jgi:hypothetical protein
VYVGNLSYEVKYRDLIEFMRGGGWGRFSSWLLLVFSVVVVVVAVAVEAVVMAPGGRNEGTEAESELDAQWELDVLRRACCSHAGTRGQVWMWLMSGGH